MLLETRQLTPTQFADAIGVARPIVSHILSGRNKPSLEVVQRILAAMPDLSMPWLLNETGPMLATAPVGTPTTAPAPSPVAVPAPASAASIPAPTATPAEQAAIVTLATPKAAPLSESAPSVTADNLGHRSPAPSSATKPSVVEAPVRPTPKRFAVIPPKFSKAAVTSTSEQSAPPTMEGPAEPVSVPPTPVPAPTEEAPVPKGALATAAPAETVASPMAAALFAGAEKPIRRIVIFYRDGSFADYQPE